MSSIPPPKGAGGGLKPPGSKIGLAKPGGLKAGLLAKGGGGGGAKSGGGAETPAPPSRQQSSVDLSAPKVDFKGTASSLRMIARFREGCYALRRWNWKLNPELIIMIGRMVHEGARSIDRRHRQRHIFSFFSSSSFFFPL